MIRLYKGQGAFLPKKPTQEHPTKWKKEVPFLLWLWFLKQTHADNSLKTTTFPEIEPTTPTKYICRLSEQIKRKPELQHHSASVHLTSKPQAQWDWNKENRADSKLFYSVFHRTVKHGSLLSTMIFNKLFNMLSSRKSSPPNLTVLSILIN